MKSLRVRPIKVCESCGSIFRMGTRESLADFTARRYCSSECAQRQLVEQIVPPSLPKKTVGKSPVRYPVQAKVADAKLQVDSQPAVTTTYIAGYDLDVSTTDHVQVRTWAQAKYHGPSEWAQKVLRRFARKQGISYEFAMALFGYDRRNWEE